MYISIKLKLLLSIIVAVVWTAFAFWISVGWVDSITSSFFPVIGMTAAKISSWAIVLGIAVVPSFSTALIYPLLVLDKRPKFKVPETLPDVTILIAAYNEENAIVDTLNSITSQNYPGHVNVLVINDGSTDRTSLVANTYIETQLFDKFTIDVITTPSNNGKAAALNTGLTLVDTDYLVTIDADTHLYTDALAKLVTNIELGPKNTAAVAGSILVKNSRTNFMTKIQEWEYFQNIASSKRAQSLLQGTLVAQGAFSVYNTKIVKELGGWEVGSMGEDIVLTWAMQKLDYRISYAEDAIAFTDVPTTYKQFFKQRERWACGLIEALKSYPGILVNMRPTLPVIWINLLLPFTEFVFLFAFIPGVLAAIFLQWYVIASIMTLLILPLTIVLNVLMYVQHKKIFKESGLEVRSNKIGCIVYVLMYLVIVCPATVCGYWREIFNIGSKNWGTK